MAVYTEGKDVETGSEEWTDADPRSGVRSGCREDHTHYIDARMGGLLHHECGYRNDGSYLLTARFMGAEDEDAKKELAAKFIRGGKLHLCLSRPCVELGIFLNIQIISTVA